MIYDGLRQWVEKVFDIVPARMVLWSSSGCLGDMMISPLFAWSSRWKYPTDQNHGLHSECESDESDVYICCVI